MYHFFGLNMIIFTFCFVSAVDSATSAQLSAAGNFALLSQFRNQIISWGLSLNESETSSECLSLIDPTAVRVIDWWPAARFGNILSLSVVSQLQASFIYILHVSAAGTDVTCLRYVPPTEYISGQLPLIISAAIQRDGSLSPLFSNSALDVRSEISVSSCSCGALSINSDSCAVCVRRVGARVLQCCLESEDIDVVAWAVLALHRLPPFGHEIAMIQVQPVDCAHTFLSQLFNTFESSSDSPMTDDQKAWLQALKWWHTLNCRPKPEPTPLQAPLVEPMIEKPEIKSEPLVPSNAHTQTAAAPKSALTSALESIKLTSGINDHIVTSVAQSNPIHEARVSETSIHKDTSNSSFPPAASAESFIPASMSAELTASKHNVNRRRASKVIEIDLQPKKQTHLPHSSSPNHTATLAKSMSPSVKSVVAIPEDDESAAEAAATSALVRLAQTQTLDSAILSSSPHHAQATQPVVPKKVANRRASAVTLEVVRPEVSSPPIPSPTVLSESEMPSASTTPISVSIPVFKKSLSRSLTSSPKQSVRRVISTHPASVHLSTSKKSMARSQSSPALINTIVTKSDHAELIKREISLLGSRALQFFRNLTLANEHTSTAPVVNSAVESVAAPAAVSLGPMSAFELAQLTFERQLSCTWSILTRSSLLSDKAVAIFPFDSPELLSTSDMLQLDLELALCLQKFEKFESSWIPQNPHTFVVRADAEPQSRRSKDIVMPLLASEAFELSAEHVQTLLKDPSAIISFNSAGVKAVPASVSATSSVSKITVGGTQHNPVKSIVPVTFSRPASPVSTPMEPNSIKLFAIDQSLSLDEPAEHAISTISVPMSLYVPQRNPNLKSSLSALCSTRCPCNDVGLLESFRLGQPTSLILQSLRALLRALSIFSHKVQPTAPQTNSGACELRNLAQSVNFASVLTHFNTSQLRCLRYVMLAFLDLQIQLSNSDAAGTAQCGCSSCSMSYSQSGAASNLDWISALITDWMPVLDAKLAYLLLLRRQCTTPIASFFASRERSVSSANNWSECLTVALSDSKAAKYSQVLRLIHRTRDPSLFVAFLPSLLREIPSDAIDMCVSFFPFCPTWLVARHLLSVSVSCASFQQTIRDSTSVGLEWTVEYIRRLIVAYPTTVLGDAELMLQLFELTLELQSRFQTACTQHIQYVSLPAPPKSLSQLYSSHCSPLLNIAADQLSNFSSNPILFRLPLPGQWLNWLSSCQSADSAATVLTTNTVMSEQNCMSAWHRLDTLIIRPLLRRLPGRFNKTILDLCARHGHIDGTLALLLRFEHHRAAIDLCLTTADVEALQMLCFPHADAFNDASTSQVAWSTRVSQIRQLISLPNESMDSSSTHSEDPSKVSDSLSPPDASVFMHLITKSDQLEQLTLFYRHIPADKFDCPENAGNVSKWLHARSSSALLSITDVVRYCLLALGPRAALDLWSRSLPPSILRRIPPTVYRDCIEAARAHAALRGSAHEILETIDAHLWTSRNTHLAAQLRAAKQAETEGLTHLMRPFAHVVPAAQNPTSSIPGQTADVKCELRFETAPELPRALEDFANHWGIALDLLHAQCSGCTRPVHEPTCPVRIHCF
jgi:hypothetical protein